MKKRLTEIAGRIVMKVVRYLAGLSDKALARLLGTTERILRLLGKSGDDLAAVIELKELARGDPNGMTLLRNLVLKSRDEQLLSMLQGVLTHYALKKPEGKLLRDMQPRGKGRQALLRLGIAGDHFDLRELGRAYRAHDQCQDVAVLAADLLAGDAALRQVNGLEISCPTLATGEFVRKALSLGKAVSVHHACFNGSESLQTVLAASGGNGARFRVFHPALYYPPVVRLKSLLDEHRVGEVCSIRIRATLGGKGGALARQAPDPERYLNHPAFDQLLLMTFLGGCVEKVTAYLNPMDPVRGGQGLINCKFVHPGRYGLLECTYAPELHVRSDFFPHDLEVEIAGTDGILWLTRGMGKRTQTAPLRLRVAREASTIGVECGLEEEWSSVYATAAGEMVRMASGKARPLIRPEEILSAFRVRERAYEASRASEVLSV